MGQLLSTGVSIAGHAATFGYDGLGDDETCVMTCTCGWSSRIESFRHPHSIIEAQSRFDQHLVELDIDPSPPRDENQARIRSGEEQK